MACCRMRLRMQPGTLVSACGGATSVTATPITAWPWHVVACGCTCNQAHLGVPVVAWHRSWPHQSQLRCCMRLHMQPGTLEGACGGMVSVHTNHSLAVACCCMRLHMQPGTLMSAGGGMTPFMATPITGWLWHAVACGCTCNQAHLGVPVVA